MCVLGQRMSQTWETSRGVSSVELREETRDIKGPQVEWICSVLFRLVYLIFSR